jgi:hypothetical protein
VESSLGTRWDHIRNAQAAHDRLRDSSSSLETFAKLPGFVVVGVLSERLFEANDGGKAILLGQLHQS